jgi:hypothetical protein
VEASVHRVGTSSEDLANLVERAIADPSQGRACREYFERVHSSAGVLERYEQLFAELLQ